MAAGRLARVTWRGDVDAGRDRARDDLAELFGLEPASRQSAAKKSRASVAGARRDLDALFGIESDAGAESTATDSKNRCR